MTQVVIDPKTGRMRTEESAKGPSVESLRRLRQEVRDRLAGNTPFHEDEFAAPKKPAVIDEDTDTAEPTPWAIFEDPDYFPFAGVC